MNRQAKYVAVAALIAATFWNGYEPAVCIAQDPPPPQPPTQPSENGKPKRSPTLNSIPQLLQYKVIKVNKLRQMVEQKIALTPDQKANINRMFDKSIEKLKTVKVEAPKPPREPGILNRPNDMHAKGEIDEREKLLIDRIKKELTPDQFTDFANTVARWQVITPRGPRPDSFQRLRRALEDPEVGLSEAQRSNSEEILGKTIGEYRSSTTRGGEIMDQFSEKAKLAIFEVLSPQQQAKFDEDLKEFAIDDGDLEKPGARKLSTFKRFEKPNREKGLPPGDAEDK